ncbi:Protein of unknown function [Gryllus bimaculatus]|nr:Protein of unknown function [Gryllus bimaculatus]
MQTRFTLFQVVLPITCGFYAMNLKHCCHSMLYVGCSRHFPKGIPQLFYLNVPLILGSGPCTCRGVP